MMSPTHQVITFRDYLLHIVGPDFIARQLSTYPGYDESVDPSISNVFATAAYRFAHLMVQPFIFRLDDQYNDHPDFPTVALHTAFFTPWRVVFEGMFSILSVLSTANIACAQTRLNQPFNLFSGGLDPIVRGLIGRRAKLNRQDSMMHDELRDRLFQFSFEVALDLAALNMQRGRDHGIPGIAYVFRNILSSVILSLPFKTNTFTMFEYLYQYFIFPCLLFFEGYNQWRRFCGLSEPRSLQELAEVMNNTDLAQRLLDLYGTPDNIDVWLGGVAEPFVRGGRVGPLFACLISTQFQKIREGDR